MSSHRTQPLIGRTSTDCTSWDLPREPIAASLARRELAGALSELPRELVEDAQMLTSELVTNALKHGQGLITLSIVPRDCAVTVRVADQGPLVPVMRAPDVTALGGRGLQLLEALAEGWGTEPVGGGQQGKAVWFRLSA